VDVFDYDLVCVPICDGGHWSLIVLYPHLRVTELRDSLEGPDRSYEATRSVPLNTVVKWLRREAEAHGRPDRVFETWRKNVKGKRSTPQQTGGNDCAFFVCENVSMLAAGREPSFTMADIPGIRRRIAMELLQAWLVEPEPHPPTGAPTEADIPPAAGPPCPRDGKEPPKRAAQDAAGAPAAKLPRPAATPSPDDTTPAGSVDIGTHRVGPGQLAAAKHGQANPLLMGSKPLPLPKTAGERAAPPPPLDKHSGRVRAADQRAMHLRRTTPTIAEQLGATRRPGVECKVRPKGSTAPRKSADKPTRAQGTATPSPPARTAPAPSPHTPSQTTSTTTTAKHVQPRTAPSPYTRSQTPSTTGTAAQRPTTPTPPVQNTPLGATGTCRPIQSPWTVPAPTPGTRHAPVLAQGVGSPSSQDADVIPPLSPTVSGCAEMALTQVSSPYPPGPDVHQDLSQVSSPSAQGADVHSELPPSLADTGCADMV
ncbi:MAG: hypothetical protein GY856_45485, partial [bacterium]|nr:hypothetical protein [bacterium]